jgi:hypothetical protein
MKYYVKKLTPQELGYRNGKQTTGAYFYISKAAIDFFPILGIEVLNDFAIISIKTKFSKEPVEATYVYHNDKFVRNEGTRNEYRVYLNRGVSPNDFSYKPGEIIVFERQSENSYNLLHFKDYDEEYLNLIEMINNSKIRGDHAFTNII